jgi:hypothetical protein
MSKCSCEVLPNSGRFNSFVHSFYATHTAGGAEGAPGRPGRTNACSRRSTAYAPTSLRLPGTAEARRSASSCRPKETCQERTTYCMMRARRWDEVAHGETFARCAIAGTISQQPFGDRPSVLITWLHTTWQPASSRMRPLHRETSMHARSPYM